MPAFLCGFSSPLAGIVDVRQGCAKASTGRRPMRRVLVLVLRFSMVGLVPLGRPLACVLVLV